MCGKYKNKIRYKHSTVSGHFKQKTIRLYVEKGPLHDTAVGVIRILIPAREEEAGVF